MKSTLPPSSEHILSVGARADDLFARHQLDIYKRTDRLFASLMGLQWIAGVIFALWVSPLAWYGTISRTHVHVWAAIFLGGAICLFPALLGLVRAGEASTRYTIAVAQMLMGALLIHLTGGRIETHFHVFGSLAFLAFYRDWRVLAARHVLAAIGVRRVRREPVAVAGARRLGHLRGRLPHRVLPPQRRGNEGHGGAHGNART